MSDKTVLPTPEIVGSLLDLPEHVRSVIKAYGDARARVALHNERAVLAASADRRDADRWRKARALFQAWEIDRAAENMIFGIPDEDECTKADNAIDAAITAAGNHKVEGE